MRKILIYLLLLLVGVVIGYAFNFNRIDEKNTQQDPEKVYIEKIKKHVVRDTIEIEKIVTVQGKIDSVYTTDTVFIIDTLSIEDDNNDFSEEKEKDEVIIMEELISQRTIPLGPAPNDSTDVSELLNLKSSAFSKEIIVEFWQSPLNLTGYELHRNKLKLFGFNPNESISLQLDKNEDQLLLNTETMSIVLRKSKQFKTLKLK